jgi:hypothetical protein
VLGSPYYNTSLDFGKCAIATAKRKLVEVVNQYVMLSPECGNEMCFGMVEVYYTKMIEGKDCIGPKNVINTCAILSHKCGDSIWLSIKTNKTE